MKKEHVVFIAVCLVGFFAFFAVDIISVDPDFGWYIRIGEYILKNGFPASDPFSYTMPSFPYINHEWLSSVAIYLIHSASPMLLSVIYAIMPIAALIACLPARKNLEIFAFFLQSVCVLLSFSGVRAQEISWLFFAVLLKIVSDDNLWKRFKFLIPFTFLLWANLHGGVAIGIFVLVMFLLTKAWEKKLRSGDALAVVLSVAATFINPYGQRIWVEIATSVGDPGLRLKIAEWLPSIFFVNLSWLILIATSLPLVYMFRNKISKTNLVIYIAIFIFSLTSIRNVPFFVFANLVLLPSLLTLLKKDFSLDAKNRFRKVSAVFLVVSLLFVLISVAVGILSERLAFPTRYPGQALISCLKKNATIGEIFSTYNLGGYLDWKLPEKKVFMDGRMPSWRQAASASESASAFDEQQDILYGKKNYKISFKKYNIKYVLLPIEVERTGLSGKIYNTLWGGTQDYSKLSKKLSKDGWKKICENQGFLVLSFSDNTFNPNGAGNYTDNN